MLLQQDTEGAEVGGRIHFSVMMPCDNPQISTSHDNELSSVQAGCGGLSRLWLGFSSAARVSVPGPRQKEQ